MKIRLKEGSPFGVFDKLLLFEDFLFGDAPGSRPCGFGWNLLTFHVVQSWYDSEAFNVFAVIFRVSRDWIIPLRLLIHTKSLSLFMCLILSSQDIASHHQKQQHIVTRNPNPYNHSPWHSSLVSCALLNWLSNSWSDSFVLIYFENQKVIMKFLLSNTMLMSSSFFSCICLAYIAILPPVIKGDSEDNCKSIGMFLIFFFFVSCRTD